MKRHGNVRGRPQERNGSTAGATAMNNQDAQHPDVILFVLHGVGQELSKFLVYFCELHHLLAFSFSRVFILMTSMSSFSKAAQR